MSALIKALIQAKLDFKPIPKDKVNPHFKSKYSTLDAILAAVEPALHANGLCIVQRIDGILLSTELWHESGEKIESQYPLPEVSDPQKFGSAITYARRYAVTALLSVTADEDEDGNAASAPAKKQAPTPTPTGNFINDAQVKRLQIELKGHGYTEGMMAAFKRDLGVDSAKKILASQWQGAMNKASDPATAEFYRQQCEGVAA